MARWHEFAVVQLATRALREEKLNIGVVVIGDQIDVRPGRNLDKIKAISRAMTTASLREALDAIPEIDTSLRNVADSSADRLNRIANLTGLKFGSIGQFEAASTEAYEVYLGHLINKLVEPEPAVRQKKASSSRLFSSFKNEMRHRRILARDGEDITSHRVVENWRVEEGLSADFALKNGHLHLIKTVDAFAETSPIRRVIQDIAVSSLVLEAARVSFGRDNVKGRIIYSANSRSEMFAMPSLETAAHQGAELINWASAVDRRAFIDRLSDLAAPLPLLDEINLRSINASVLPNSKLN
ncbi:hypothetical protein DC429_08280 [Arthrobacter sp. TPD3018]|uniref:DUF3037 domain-containing protein n=1 Tax=Bacteria TaxID=2 RepID=UPI000D5192AC|nr:MULTISPECIES: DUF3037 domain-containing protein [Bacteria]PVE58086.1 hypothetical protein DC425_09730 [Sphingomonas sp. TPD3009]PVE58310.1 hypothetical protein DC429_08280 [Arthrobacter sp. TPD3018]PVE87935.1 hypothetical protein DC431_04905 [Sphingomonas melonis]